jgi:hypothetical protein
MKKTIIVSLFLYFAASAYASDLKVGNIVSKNESLSVADIIQMIPSDAVINKPDKKIIFYTDKNKTMMKAVFAYLIKPDAKDQKGNLVLCILDKKKEGWKVTAEIEGISQFHPADWLNLIEIKDIFNDGNPVVVIGEHVSSEGGVLHLFRLEAGTYKDIIANSGLYLLDQPVFEDIDDDKVPEIIFQQRYSPKTVVYKWAGEKFKENPVVLTAYFAGKIKSKETEITKIKKHTYDHARKARELFEAYITAGDKVNAKRMAIILKGDIKSFEPGNFTLDAWTESKMKELGIEPYK